MVRHGKGRAWRPNQPATSLANGASRDAELLGKSAIVSGSQLGLVVGLDRGLGLAFDGRPGGLGCFPDGYELVVDQQDPDTIDGKEGPGQRVGAVGWRGLSIGPGLVGNVAFQEDFDRLWIGRGLEADDTWHGVGLSIGSAWAYSGLARGASGSNGV